MSSEPGLLVIGSGPAGLAAATAYREGKGEGPVLIVSADPHPPYDRPPLSKDFLRGDAASDSLALQDEAFYAEHDITLRLATSVASLDTTRKVAVLEDGEELSYAACVIATGSDPSVPPIEGADDADLFYLRNVEDAEGLRTAAAGASSAVVIGSGFIGCEAAMSLRELGLEVTLVSSETLPQADRLGPEVAARIAGWLREAGVTLLGDQHVDSIEGVDAGGTARTVRAGDASYVADLVLVATGAAPASVDLAEAAGIDTEDGRILTDEHLATSADGVFAAGDVVLAQNAVAGRRIAVRHWDDADAMGAVAGANAAGGAESWGSVPGFWTDLGEHTLQYAAWGDGHDDVRLDDRGDGSFTAWYGRDGVTVGVLTHQADDDYERGRGLVEKGEPLPQIADREDG